MVAWTFICFLHQSFNRILSKFLILYGCVCLLTLYFKKITDSQEVAENVQGSSHASFTKSAPLVTSINQRYLKTKKLTLEYSTEVIQIFTALKVCVCVCFCAVLYHMASCNTTVVKKLCSMWGLKNYQGVWNESLCL